MRTVIRGTGMHVPANVVDNDRLAKFMDTSDAWVRQRTGIVRRRFADPDQATSDLAVPAAALALQEAGLDPRDVDYVVFATMTPDFYFPGSGPIFARKLGLRGVPCLDVRQQCTGFLYGLHVADAMIRSGTYRNVLVVGAEIHGGFMTFRSWDAVLGRADAAVSDEERAWNTKFRDRFVLFGDGAGAFVVSGEEGGARGFEGIRVHADGTWADKMWVPAGGTAYRPYFHPRMSESGDVVPIVEGREVFRMAVTLMPEAILSLLAEHGHTLDDLRLLVMHQANLRINEAVQARLGLPDDRVFNNIQEYGNTTAATLPMAFHEARRARDLAPGDLVGFVAVGSGLTWGAALYRV